MARNRTLLAAQQGAAGAQQGAAAAQQGATVLMSLHDIGLAAAVADDAWLLGNGQLVASGPANQVMEPGQLRSVFGIDYERLNRSDGTSWLVPAPESV